MDDATQSLHVAGLLVSTHPAELAAVEQRLSLLPGLAVHGSDPDSGRLVVTIETDSLEEQETLFAGVSRVPGVWTVSLVCHRSEPLLVPGGAQP